jgi:hypothetical protein
MSRSGGLVTAATGDPSTNDWLAVEAAAPPAAPATGAARIASSSEPKSRPDRPETG